MLDQSPDIHHLRTFESLAYAHVRADARRRKLNRHAKIGYVLGYADDVLDCKLHFPDDRTRKFVPDIRVNEHVLYRDRHTTTATLSDANSDVNVSIEESDYVAETEATDSIMEDAELNVEKSIIDDDDCLTDAQYADEK